MDQDQSQLRRSYNSSSKVPSQSNSNSFNDSSSNTKNSPFNISNIINHNDNKSNYSMFSPQAEPSSPFNSNYHSNSPPQKKIRNDSASSMNLFLSTQKQNTASIEPNLSYARSYSSSSLANANESQPHNYRQSHSAHQTPPPLNSTASTNHSDEDERFLRLAREALVATASGASPSGSVIVDPTIQDLLQRLQYAASPHGNPIKRSNKIRANENGQLMIQGFYQQFPNLSNDIFMNDASHQQNDKSANHPSNSRNDDWNFLLDGDEPVHLKNNNYESISSLNRNDHSALPSPEARSSVLSSNQRNLSTSDNSDPTRKFLCIKCSMSFRRSSDLKRHEKQHLTIPPNICELCGKGFARKDALKRHMGTLTCKRNADKKLYVENLNFLREKKHSDSNNRLNNQSNNNVGNPDVNDWQI